MPPDLHFKSCLAVRRPGSWPSGQHLAPCAFGGQEAWMALSATNFVLALVQPEACRRVVLSSLSSGESWPLGEALKSVPGDPVWARRPLLAAHGASSRRKKRLRYCLCPGGTSHWGWGPPGGASASSQSPRSHLSAAPPGDPSTPLTFVSPESHLRENHPTHSPVQRR